MNNLCLHSLPNSVSGPLPEGVVLRQLQYHTDDRGVLSEIYRQEWHADLQLPQWNVSHCVNNSLRGVHLHFRHTDYLVVLSGRFIFGLRDLRREAGSFGRTAMLNLTGGSLLIPPGVAHGFHCVEAGSLVYGMTHNWDLEDDLACRWDDPDLDLPFPAVAPILSARDRDAGSLQDLLTRFEEVSA